MSSNKVCGREPGTRLVPTTNAISPGSGIWSEGGFLRAPHPPQPLWLPCKSSGPQDTRPLGWVMVHSTMVLHVAALLHGCCSARSSSWIAVKAAGTLRSRQDSDGFMLAGQRCRHWMSAAGVRFCRALVGTAFEVRAPACSHPLHHPLGHPLHHPSSPTPSRPGASITFRAHQPRPPRPHHPLKPLAGVQVRPAEEAWPGARLGAPAVLVQQDVQHVDGGVGVTVPHP